MIEFLNGSGPEEIYRYDPDRTANKRELENLPTNRPSISGEGTYKGEFSVDATLDYEEIEDAPFFRANIKRWVFKLS